MNEAVSTARTLTGKVVSNSMEKTIAVEVERQVKHALYGKYIRKSSKILAHDEMNECGDGDTVAIEECRPLSKNKSWRLQKVIKKATLV
ncbi:MAG: 30S ribosomal protein S17 [Gammaproteobacteria bacterium]|jgi:small subunit ribosomal protein S17|nr:30S ribosomal protein S17 [Pseudomonadota bacterium]MDG2301880.1 30S ribosomal protein S17 [Gammaproteobacteria bacterium]MBT5066675.1 30S ribosomal protein S17 [Pseudomonadota bacterium]MBT6192156.1 30S ribosomal protein S17 [Pseudomonadota bacterium]MBT6465819.1 30S ribosomal protein S17 [Pseudomonadota bacterium]|tara:strand:+ start:3877 stop:4143 length:267 start_codon:yes stop_codon:yes gene_type:complete